MSRQTILRILFAIGILMAILGIAAPVYFYVKDFGVLSRSTNPSDWGPFGDYFGGILNPIISFLTLIVTIIIAININRIEKRNHDETVHNPVMPFFVVGDGYFYSSDISLNGLTVEKDYYDYTEPTSPAGAFDHLNKRFYLKIFNKGLGVATNVVATFEIGLNELRNALKIDHEKIKTEVSEVKKDDEGRDFIVLTIDAEKHFNYKAFMFKIWSIERAGLGVVDNEKEVHAVIPTQMMGAFRLMDFLRRLDIRANDFPTMMVTFSFKNIYGKSMASKFRVGLYHVHDYGRFSVYRILQEVVK